MDPVEGSVALPRSTGGGPHAGFLAALVQALSAILNRWSVRINQVLPKDGTERMTGPLGLVEYTIATLPAASAANRGHVVYVSDGSAGQKYRGSDGSSWLNIA